MCACFQAYARVCADGLERARVRLCAFIFALLHFWMHRASNSQFFTLLVRQASNSSIVAFLGASGAI
jgi:hypothetical protein